MAQRKNTSIPGPKSQQTLPHTLSALRQEPDLWYRIRVLVYDIGHSTTDPESAKRIDSGTSEIHISPPYFTPSEAIKILTTRLDIPPEDTPLSSTTTPSENLDQETNTTTTTRITLENALYNRLSNFLDKRRASGDSRPCGPHDLVPVYAEVFGIGKEEMRDERFLSRVRRSGLGGSKRARESEKKVGEGKGRKE
ncbi:hypothetical protein P7C71_g2229, partial [Lecanoromycetidae sp. Uapishka_2]